MSVVSVVLTMLCLILVGMDISDQSFSNYYAVILESNNKHTYMFALFTFQSNKYFVNSHIPHACTHIANIHVTYHSCEHCLLHNTHTCPNHTHRSTNTELETRGV